MTRLAAAQALLYRLAEAALLAWRQDKVFRGAVIGMGVTLAVLVARLETPSQDHALPPLDTSTAGMPALSNPVGGVGVRPAQALSDPVPKIAPGRSLEDLKISPVPNGDRFGTVTSGKHP
jgi:hypothetical protein